MVKLILASKSPRRQQILKDNGFIFKVFPANIDEEKYENLPPVLMARTLAKLKAEKVAYKFNSSIIISADTTINLNGKMIGKPKNKMHAKEILGKLSGNTHKVITAYAIVNSGKISISHEVTLVTFKKITNTQINEYINKVNVLGFAGAYGIQDGADKFVKQIKGDYLNIVGLPKKALTKLNKILH